MGYGLIDNNTLTDIADAIRNKIGGTANYYPRDMARAIDQIMTSNGGFKYPVILSLRSQRYYDYIINNMNNILCLEQTNQISNLINSEPYNYQIIYKDHWSLSPCDVTVYVHTNAVINTLFYSGGNYVGMSPNVNSYFSGSTLNTILMVYDNAPSDPNYVVKYGDVICNSSYNTAYIWDNKYFNNGVNCWRLIYNAGYNRAGTLYHNLTQNGNNIILASRGVAYGLGIDSDMYNAEDISIIEMDYLANGSDSVINAVSGPYTKSMVNTYASCDRILEAVCGRNVTDLINTYYSCDGLTKAVIGPNVLNACSAYLSCSQITEVIGNATNLTNGKNTFYGCGNLRQTIDFPNLTDGTNMFLYCSNLLRLPSTPNLVNGYAMYSNSNLITPENIQNYLNECTKLKDVSNRMFSCGTTANSLNVMNLIFPDSVTDFSYMFNGDMKYYEWDEANQQNVPHSWVDGDAVCPNSVVNFRECYAYCNNLLNAVCGPNVVDMYNCYYACNKLTNAVCGPNVIYFNNTYAGCVNLLESVCGENVRYMSYTYGGCYSLQNASCGNNVIYLSATYQSCNNLIDAVCGPNVVYMVGTYYGCANLINAACGPNVISLDSAYHNCWNLHEAVCGEAVIYMNNAYKNCWNLQTAAVGPNVIYMEYAYSNCYNLTNGVCGSNVIEMNYAYDNCTNLTDAYLGPRVRNAINTYKNCTNLLNAYIANGLYIAGATQFSTLHNTFYNCTKLNNVIMEENIQSMYNTFCNCQNLVNVIIPKNIVTMPYAFYNCVNLACDIEIGLKCNNIQNTFRYCNKIPNIFIEGNEFASIANYYPVLNAFNRNNYTVRRNIVVNNYAGFNKLVYYNFAGNFIKTNETYAEPVEVFVNGKSYNAVRCSYNTTYNCYIYCTE